MSRRLSRLVALVAAAFASTSIAAQIPGGSLFVSQSGSDSALPSTNGAQASIRVFQTNGKEQATINIPKGKLQIQGTRGGHLALSLDGKFAALAGYIPPFSGTGTLNTRSSSDAARGYVQISVKGGGISSSTEVTDEDQESADAVVTDGDRAWLGGGDKLVYWHGQTDVVFDQSTFVSPIFPNAFRAFDGQLYMTGLRPAFFGFVASFSGFPHGNGDNPTVIFDVTNPEDLAVTDGGDTIYVARSEGVVDVYHKDGSWSITNRLTAGGAALHGVTVDFSGDDPIVYAIDSKRLWKVTDKGKNATFKQIATAEKNRAFLGIVLTPGGGAPQLKLTTPRVYTTSRTTVTIRGTAVDADGLKKIKVKRGRNGSYKTATGTTEWSYRTTLKRGANFFFVVAVDGANNESAAIPVKITRE